MSGIGALLERFETQAPHGVEKAFAAFAPLQINLHHALDRVGNLLGAEGRPQDVADAGVLGARAPQLQLVEFHAFLVDAQNADVSGMMVAASVDAAGDLDLQLADLALARREALGNPLRDGNGARIGEVGELKIKIS